MKNIKKIYKKYKPSDVAFLCNTQLITELAKASPESISHCLYDMWEAIKKDIEK